MKNKDYKKIYYNLRDEFVIPWMDEAQDNILKFLDNNFMQKPIFSKNEFEEELNVLDDWIREYYLEELAPKEFANFSHKCLDPYEDRVCDCCASMKHCDDPDCAYCKFVEGMFEQRNIKHLKAKIRREYHSRPLFLKLKNGIQWLMDSLDSGFYIKPFDFNRSNLQTVYKALEHMESINKDFKYYENLLDGFFWKEKKSEIPEDIEPMLLNLGCDFATLKNIFALSDEHKTEIEKFTRDFKDFIQWDETKD